MDTIILFCGTLIGETMGSLIVGGSFIVQPTVLLAGLTMHQAVALDVTASCMTSVSGLATLRSAGRTLPTRQILLPIVAAVLGACFGPLVMAMATPTELAWGFALSAIVVAALTWAGRKCECVIDTPHPRLVAATAAVLGLYTGLSGAGAGIMAVALLTRCGLTTIGAVAMRKVIFIPATIVSAFSYVWHGFVPWSALAPMAIACALAGWLGTRIMLRLGDAKIDRMYQLAALVLAVTTVWQLI